MRVAVIGAGPSGLVTLKYLLYAHESLGTEPIEARIFEAEDFVGGTFHARTYEDAELVSSRQLTTFSDFRVPEGPDFLSARRYVQYLRDYATHFKLWPHIQFSSRVTRVAKRSSSSLPLPTGKGQGQGQGHTVTYTNAQGQAQTWHCDAVAVCSGRHVFPNMPAVPGIERVPRTLHSSAFKSRAQFGMGQTVLILGSGETASDVAYLAVTAPTARVVMCHRDGFHLAPKPLLVGMKPRSAADPAPIPIDVSRASLFDTAYCHPWLRKSMALWWYYDWYVGCIMWLSWGTMHGLDQWVGGLPKGWSTSQVYFNKSGKISPYINNAWKPKKPTSRLLYLRSLIMQDPPHPLPAPTCASSGQRTVELAPWPESIAPDGRVRFRDNGRPEYARMQHASTPPVRPDLVVYCTGYRVEFPFLAERCAVDEDVCRPDVREIWNRRDPSLGFIGFNRPSLGAIPPLAEMQAQLWVLNLLAPERVCGPLDPADEAHYRLHPRPPSAPAFSDASSDLLPLTPSFKRGQDDPDGDDQAQHVLKPHGVDHESYVYQLALDLGAAPSFWEVLRMAWTCDNNNNNNKASPKARSRASWWWKLPLVWALGANFNTKFRLRGPWAWDGAVEVLVEELWETVARRPAVFGHFTLTILPMLVFGPISLLVWLCALVVGAVQAVASFVVSI